jgi:hypothetical protein
MRHISMNCWQQGAGFPSAARYRQIGRLPLVFTVPYHEVRLSAKRLFPSKVPSGPDGPRKRHRLALQRWGEAAFQVPVKRVDPR